MGFLFKKNSNNNANNNQRQPGNNPLPSIDFGFNRFTTSPNPSEQEPALHDISFPEQPLGSPIDYTHTSPSEANLAADLIPESTFYQPLPEWADDSEPLATEVVETRQHYEHTVEAPYPTTLSLDQFISSPSSNRISPVLEPVNAFNDTNHNSYTSSSPAMSDQEEHDQAMYVATGWNPEVLFPEVAMAPITPPQLVTEPLPSLAQHQYLIAAPLSTTQGSDIDPLPLSTTFNEPPANLNPLWADIPEPALAGYPMPIDSPLAGDTTYTRSNEQRTPIEAGLHAISKPTPTQFWDEVALNEVATSNYAPQPAVTIADVSSGPVWDITPDPTFVDPPAYTRNVANNFNDGSRESDFWTHAAPGFDDDDLLALNQPDNTNLDAFTPGSTNYAGMMHDAVGEQYYPAPTGEPLPQLDAQESSPWGTDLAMTTTMPSMGATVQPLDSHLLDNVPSPIPAPAAAPFESLTQNWGAPALTTAVGLAVAGGLANGNHNTSADTLVTTPQATIEAVTPFTTTVLEQTVTHTGLEPWCNPSQLHLQEVVSLAPSRVLTVAKLATGNSVLLGVGGDRLSIIHCFDHNVLEAALPEALHIKHSLEGAANGKELYLVQINRWKAVVSFGEQGFALHTIMQG
jgi:hypothetical protein